MARASALFARVDFSNCLPMQEIKILQKRAWPGFDERFLPAKAVTTHLARKGL
ncbi:MAG: hypothetical protein KF805_13435 [Phycisphaeraceae bacterium]|nr:hypothetical protein [Phycisphaeraceae bacterium]